MTHLASESARRPLIGMYRRDAGFTLIEMLIVLAIIAILAAIAYPAYTDSVIKGKRSQGRTALLDLMQQQERYFTQYNTYLSFAVGGTNATDNNGNAVTPIPFKTFAGDSVASAPYKLSATTCGGGSTLRDCVLLTAEIQAPFSDPLAGNLTYQSTGAKSCTGTTSDKTICWK